jgi:hypothetical protein
VKCGRILHMTQLSPDPPVQEPAPAAGSSSGAVNTDLQQLIRSAFDIARRSGRSDWQQMSAAVLKNRLLDLTNRTFDERDYGAQSIGDLVRKMPDLLLVDESTRPPTVKLLTAGSSLVKIESAAGSRIRSDLWHAIIDYRSGKQYVWDGSVAVPQEGSAGDESDSQVMPTITADAMDRWRSEFSNQVRPLVADDDSIQAELDRWQAERLPTLELPALLRGRWNATLNEHVASTLSEWFNGQSIPVPSDLMQSGRDSNSKSRRPTKAAVDELRDLVMRCVRVMTDEELRELRLPPAAVLRSRQ